MAEANTQSLNGLSSVATPGVAS